MGGWEGDGSSGEGSGGAVVAECRATGGFGVGVGLRNWVCAGEFGLGDGRGVVGVGGGGYSSSKRHHPHH